MYVKLHKSYRTVVAVCDENIIGQTFEEGEKQLEVRESFYKGRQINKEETIKLMKFQVKEDATFNIVGENSINAALEAEIIDENAIGKVQGVPFALVLL